MLRTFCLREVWQTIYFMPFPVLLRFHGLVVRFFESWRDGIGNTLRCFEKSSCAFADTKRKDVEFHVLRVDV